MGNTMMVRRRNKAKVMKIDGDIFRIKTPARVSNVTKEYPGFVLLDSETVKLLGVNAKPLEPKEFLKPNKTYFLVELPPETAKEEPDKMNKLPYRRVMSGIHVGAKERLDMLLLSQRTVSDITVPRNDGGDGQRKVRLRIPRSQITKFMEESQDVSEVAEKIVALYFESSCEVQGDRYNNDLSRKHPGIIEVKNNCKAREKHVSFAEKGGRGEIVVL